ncbi:hypothetical protein COCCADRAFT_23173 [Bipolaris zeicola 26-R-13]|uniref:Uncharacterized protein n=1 Tax=Cochliobolus carbonum (strain 26-R-13) TaxID=930089 RepID=W6YH76_COCC2|nr:uncharacterized protein COCCADRAFT_23173 [Bipolaris zeicola 26-R-13]EUC37083.1 hypothetical protein COCCADRAFT_23173 [Bipolaris zeicola 26-R-13]
MCGGAESREEGDKGAREQSQQSPLIMWPAIPNSGHHQAPCAACTYHARHPTVAQRQTHARTPTSTHPSSLVASGRNPTTQKHYCRVTALDLPTIPQTSSNTIASPCKPNYASCLLSDHGLAHRLCPPCLPPSAWCSTA